MSKTKKQRLDTLLVTLGLCDSRERAKSIILAGNVLVNEQVFDKAGSQVDVDSNIRLLTKNNSAFVSRGGTKIDGALSHFDIDVTDKICMDVGASTGGFTDCLLQRGAKKVYSVDVGYGQLHWKIRNDPRIVIIDRKNIRFITPDDIPDEIDLSVIDVSFISLELVLPPIFPLIKKNGEILALIKPQFEVGKGGVGKGGVVRDKEKHIEVLKKISNLTEKMGFTKNDTVPSELPGQKGNIEYFIYLNKEPGNK